MKGMGRALMVFGVGAAAYGGFHFSQAAPEPGQPIPGIPAAALLVGAAMFATGFRLFGVTAAALPELAGDWNVGGVDRRWAGAALLACAVTAGSYAIAGYHPLLLVGWVGSWLVASRSVWSARTRASHDSRLSAGEIGFLAALLATTALLVLPYLGDLPYEISTDEIFLTLAVRDFLDGTARDPFGLVPWWGLPAMYFATASIWAQMIGTSIEAMRLVTAVSALLILVPCYLWIRTLHGRTVATVATVLLAFAHAFVGWGRIALHQNSPLLLLTVALALLVLGLRDRCPLKVLWGGIVLGAGFYTYPSGQISIMIWLVALAGLLGVRRLPARAALVVGLLTVFGFLLAVAPMLVTAITEFEAFTQRAQAVAITNPQALETLGREWGLEPGAEVIRENVKRGLLAFNAPYPYVNYYNPGNALVDPVTGSLLWVGLGLAIAWLRHPGLLLATVGFLAAYLPNLFTEGAPVHGRLLIALPFVAVLSAEALVRAVRVVTPQDPKFGGLRTALLTVAVAFVAVLNLSAVRDAARWQMTTGRNDAVTAIGRTLGTNVELDGPLRRFFRQDRKWDPRNQVVYITEESEPLIRWGEPEDWHEWIGFFADGDDVHEYPNVEAFLADNSMPFWGELTVFVPTSAANRTMIRLSERYSHLHRTAITPNRRLSAIRIER